MTRFPSFPSEGVTDMLFSVEPSAKSHPRHSPVGSACQHRIFAPPNCGRLLVSGTEAPIAAPAFATRPTCHSNAGAGLGPCQASTRAGLCGLKPVRTASSAASSDASGSCGSQRRLSPTTSNQMCGDTLMVQQLHRISAGCQRKAAERNALGRASRRQSRGRGLQDSRIYGNSSE